MCFFKNTQKQRLCNSNLVRAEIYKNAPPRLLSVNSIFRQALNLSQQTVKKSLLSLLLLLYRHALPLSARLLSYKITWKAGVDSIFL